MTALVAEIVPKQRSRVSVILVSVAVAIALPQLMHWLGVIAGRESLLAQVLLPMHIPVLVAGLLGGRLAGLAVGVASPLISFGISGMPVPAVLPSVLVELAVLGLTAGLVASTPLPTILKVLVAQVAGRVARLGWIGLGLPLPAARPQSLSMTWDAMRVSWPGIVLQLCLIPLLVRIVARHTAGWPTRVSNRL